MFADGVFTNAVAALHQGAPAQMTLLKSLRPGLVCEKAQNP